MSGRQPRAGQQGSVAGGDADSGPCYALITGASTGIGLALAEECALRGMNLILVALPHSGLPEAAKGLSQRLGVKVEAREMNLAAPGSPRRLFDWVREKGFSVNMLVNNAGIDYPGLFEDSELDKNERLINLNILAVVRLSHLFLPELRRHSPAYLLNVASVAAFFPMPYKPIYSPSKAFVLNFTLALRQELKGSTVQVSALCPGGVMTNSSCRERIAVQGFFGRISSLLPDQVASFTLKRLVRGDALIIPGWANKLFRFLGAVVPRPLFLQAVYRRFSKDEQIIRRRYCSAT